MEAPVDVVPSVEPPVHLDDAAPKAALTPPTSEDNDKRDERMSSELSDIDSDDGEDIEPDHYFEGGKIPVFKPVRDNAAHACMPSRDEACAQLCFARDNMAPIADYDVCRPWTNSATSSASSTKLTSME
jgi:hypothetical protein